MKPKSRPTKVTVFFDGACAICHKEMLRYKRLLGNKAHFIDISSPRFRAQAYGLDEKKVQKTLHIISNGKILTGVDAFFAIWDELPYLQPFTGFLKKWPIKKAMEVGYFSFNLVRPYLPSGKKKIECKEGHCALS